MGIWSLIPSPALIEVCGRGGFDFQIFDMEHGPFDYGDIDAGARSAEGAGCAPLVRVPTADPVTVQRCLDIGAQGIVFPQMKGLPSAKDALSTMAYGPAGRRGFNPFTRAGGYSGSRSPQTPALFDAYAARVVIVETLGAARQLPRIAALRELDVVYLGVYDMSIALGCGGDVSDPRVRDFVRKAAKIIIEAGKAVGLMVRSKADIGRALDLGARFLVYGVDTAMVRGAVAEAVGALRAAGR